MFRQMHIFLQDIRYAFRLTIKSPGFAAVTILSLALGIGANTAVFSVINGVLLRPLPYPMADRLLIVQMSRRQQLGDQTYLSYPTYLDLKESAHAFDEWAAFVGISLNLTGTDEPERIIGTMASASLFPLLGVEPVVGRAFSGEEESPGHDRVVILSYRLWQRRFGGDPGVVGQNVLLNDVSRTVIGVMPQNFRFPHEDADFWVPLAPSDWARNARENTVYQAIGRLSVGATPEQAQAEMEAVAARLAQQYPESMSGYQFSLTILRERVLGDVGRPLLVLFGAALFVLLITCANIGNLLLVRATRREREIAIRLSLGASRRRLARQLLTESALLSLCGGAAGLLFAHWGIRLLVAFLSERDVPRLNEVALNGRVLGFTLLISTLSALVFGMVPVLHSSRFNLLDSLKEGAQQLS